MSDGRQKVDWITREVVRNRLDSIVREMANITVRTARSPVVHSGRDFSCGLFNSKAELLTIGANIPVHILPIVWQLRNTLARFEGDVREGDIFIGNDPYDGGTHLNDVLVFIPAFYRGELIGFICNRAHWTEIGGSVPGSISGTATEIYQEGLRIPPIRIGRKDKLDPNILEIIARNVRAPREAIGDLWAQLASCRVAAQRISELMWRYGKLTVLRIWEDILNESEQRMRSLIKGLPKGRLVHEGYLDNDGVKLIQRRIRVTVTVNQDHILVDFTGSSPQTDGPLNVAIAMAHCYAFMGVKAALDPKGPINSGCFRPIRVVVPEGTLLNARPPAAVAGMPEVGQAAIITMVALSKLVPDKVSAEESGAGNQQTYSTVDLRSSEQPRVIYYDALSCGGGARSTKDGLDFVRTIRSGNYQAPSMELLEYRFPVRFLRHEFRQDSGGPGKFRGGVGIVREYRVLSEGSFSMVGDHAIVPPGGLYGGYAGACTRWEVVRGAETLPISPKFHSKATSFALQADDIVRCCTPGGGGWGDPLEREVERVVAQVLNGYVSVRQAREIYGVVIDPRTLKPDEAATRQHRAALSAQRLYLRAGVGGAPDFRGGVRIARVGEAVGAWGVLDGCLADLFSAQRPNPLRVRINLHRDIGAESCVLDAEAARDLGVSEGEPILLRLVSDAVASGEENLHASVASMGDDVMYQGSGLGGH